MKLSRWSCALHGNSRRVESPWPTLMKCARIELPIGLLAAAGVDRGIVEKGANMLGVDVDRLIAEVIAAMRPRAAELGLAGAGPASRT